MSKEQLVDELHRSARKNFSRRSYMMRGIDDTFQADLIEMIPYARKNRGYKYILVVIDTFSKFAWTRPLKNKTGKLVTEAMGSIFKANNRICRNLQTDHGKEFYNNSFNSLMKTYKINHYSTYSNLKASIVERLNRTLLTKIWKMFSLQGSHKWINNLQKTTDSYNNQQHSTIKMKPVNVDKTNETDILNNAYRKNHTTNSSEINKFVINDFVRVSKFKSIFEKGYKPNWSTEVFQISSILPTQPITYILKDTKSKAIKGAFYKEELQKTECPDVYLIDKIIRKRNGKLYVKWLGHDASFNSWIDETDIV